jgi:hypothetical protein
MTFETKQQALDWYEKQPRALTNHYVNSIDWPSVRHYRLDRRLVPVITYMRDVETLTDMYYRELRRTPTGKDPVIGKFMERWAVEETLHGELLNRFLAEAGEPRNEKWREQVRHSVSRAYRLNSRLTTVLTNLVGRRFTATHMTFGAIHEMSTTQGYRRLMLLAQHPVLDQILTAIIREESAHTKFYASVARIELSKDRLAQKIARRVIEYFWQPVGQGSLPERRTHYVISTLFGGDEGRECARRTVADRVRLLPGFSDLTRIMETVDMICGRAAVEVV